MRLPIKRMAPSEPARYAAPIYPVFPPRGGRSTLLKLGACLSPLARDERLAPQFQMGMSILERQRTEIVFASSTS